MGNIYTVESSGPIPGLGGINGPLTTPTPMAFNDVLYMIRNGYKVYQHNPFDISEKVKVTIDNVKDVSFKSSAAVATSRRMLNKQVQEMDTPKKVVVTKDETVVIDTKKKVANDNVKKGDIVPVTSPDVFKK